MRVPWTARRSNQSILKEINPEFSLGRLMLPDAKSWLIRKDPDAGKDWRQEKGMTEDKMVGWLYQLNGHEFEQALGDNVGQGRLACCSPWGHKESDTTERLNNWYVISSLPVSQTEYLLHGLGTALEANKQLWIEASLCPLERLHIKGKHQH